MNSSRLFFIRREDQSFHNQVHEQLCCKAGFLKKSSIFSLLRRFFLFPLPLKTYWLYGLGFSFRGKKQPLHTVDEAVFLYNTKRTHAALNIETGSGNYIKVIGIKKPIE
jgi:transposase InsO family protein